MQAQIEVKPSYGLDDETITQMLRDSMANAKDDAAARARAEAKVEAEGLMVAVQAALDLDADLLDEAELSHIQSLMAQLHNSLPNHTATKSAPPCRQLSHATDDVRRAAQDRNIQRALGGVSVESL